MNRITDLTETGSIDSKEPEGSSIPTIQTEFEDKEPERYKKRDTKKKITSVMRKSKRRREKIARKKNRHK